MKWKTYLAKVLDPYIAYTISLFAALMICVTMLGTLNLESQHMKSIIMTLIVFHTFLHLDKRLVFN